MFFFCLPALFYSWQRSFFYNIHWYPGKLSGFDAGKPPLGCHFLIVRNYFPIFNPKEKILKSGVFMRNS